MEEIENFVVGNLKIAKNRLFLEKKDGGLGLIDIENYIGSQACSWVRRAYFLNDSWKRDLFFLSDGNVFNLRQSKVDKIMNPIIFFIAGHFERFLYAFTVEKENFRRAHFFDNPCFTFDVNRQHFLKKSFFTEDEWDTYKNQIQNLTFDRLVSMEGIIKSKIEFEIGTGLRLTELKFAKIESLARSSIAKYSRADAKEKKTDTVQNFLMRIKKGSRRVRAILEKKITATVSSNMVKYAQLTETIIDYKNSEILNSAWSFSYLKNSVRTFTFKLHNNILGLNTRVSHFVRGHPRTCTFCDLSNEPEEREESTLHLFFECMYVEPILNNFYKWLFEADNDYFLSRSEFFVGFNCENDSKKKSLLVVNILVKKYIWDCKQRFYLPTLIGLKNQILSELQLISCISRLWHGILCRSGLFENNRIQF